MPIAPTPDSGSHHDRPADHSTDQEHWGRTGQQIPSPQHQGRRFSGVHLAVTGVSSLLVGVLATTLTFTLIGDSDDGEDARAAAQDAPRIPAGGFDDSLPVEDDEPESGDDTIGVGEGFTVTTGGGAEVVTYVEDFSVDESCKYGRSDSRLAEKSPGSRIVQLTVDVTNKGADGYSMDRLSALSSRGYTQPVETSYVCEEPNDGANRWPGFGSVDAGEKKLLYGAFEVQSDATQLVLDTASNGRVLIDIPEQSAGAGEGSPEPTTTAG